MPTHEPMWDISHSDHHGMVGHSREVALKGSFRYSCVGMSPQYSPCPQGRGQGMGKVKIKGVEEKRLSLLLLLLLEDGHASDSLAFWV